VVYSYRIRSAKFFKIRKFKRKYDNVLVNGGGEGRRNVYAVTRHNEEQEEKEEEKKKQKEKCAV
jgi:hypothetical protein